MRTDYAIVRLIEFEYFLGRQLHKILKNNPHMKRTIVYRIWKTLDTWGVPYPEQRLSIWGRPRKMSSEMVKSLIDLIAIRSTLFLDELQYHILTTFQLLVSEKTISRTLKDSEFTQKVTQRITAQRDKDERGRWYVSLGEWSADMLVFVDESAANERTLDRKYGWALRGIPAIDHQILHQSIRWSILPAYTIHGYLNHSLIMQGSVDSETFCNWLNDHILPQCNAFPGPRSVLIMDNCSTQK